MKCYINTLVVFLSLFIQMSFAVTNESDFNIVTLSTNGTLVTSKSLLLDQKEGKAIFDGNVCVEDKELTIKTDRLIIYFTKDYEIIKIEALGNVVISREEFKATSKKAEFEVETGKVVLTGSPRVTRQEDTLSGETITFWRKEDRILCEPNAMLFIRSNDKGIREGLKRR